jgi:hypothetical protein
VTLDEGLASTMDGSLYLTVTFKQKSEIDRAQVRVQNRVAQALLRLPEEVRNLGVNFVHAYLIAGMVQDLSLCRLLAAAPLKPARRLHDVHLSTLPAARSGSKCPGTPTPCRPGSLPWVTTATKNKLQVNYRLLTTRTGCAAEIALHGWRFIS